MPKKRAAKDLGKIDRKLDEILKDIRQILGEEKKVETEEKILEKGERAEETEELRAERTEEKGLSELGKLEALEKEVEKQVEPHPLKRITYKDVARSTVGAFFGAVAHYTFIYGLEVASRISVNRATILYIISLSIGAIFLYATGFRKIKDPKILAFLPLRLLIIYITSLAMAVLVLFLFQPGFGSNLIDAYKQVATVTLIAVMGAATADMIGRD